MAGFIEEYVGFEPSPDFDFRINAIIEFWSNPCDAPWTVYIKTLYPAVGRFILVLVDTDLLDILRSYLRPRQGLTRGPRRSKGRRRGRGGGIPDTADMVARMVPGRDFFEGRSMGPNEGFLWKIDGVIQRGLWYWLVIDATTDLFYWWAAGIRKEEFCHPHGRPALFATDDNPFCTAAAGLYLPMGAFSAQWQDGGASIFITSVHVAAGNWLITAHGDYTGVTDSPGHVTLRLSGAQGSYTSGANLVQGAPVPITVHAQVKGPTVMTAEHRLVGDLFCTGTNGIIMARPL